MRTRRAVQDAGATSSSTCCACTCESDLNTESTGGVSKRHATLQEWREGKKYGSRSSLEIHSLSCHPHPQCAVHKLFCRPFVSRVAFQIPA